MHTNQQPSHSDGQAASPSLDPCWQNPRATHLSSSTFCRPFLHVSPPPSVHPVCSCSSALARLTCLWSQQNAVAFSFFFSSTVISSQYQTPLPSLLSSCSTRKLFNSFLHSKQITSAAAFKRHARGFLPNPTKHQMGV